MYKKLLLRSTLIMAGMALCAAKPNSLSQFVVELPGQWLELLRVYQTT